MHGCNFAKGQPVDNVIYDTRGYHGYNNEAGSDVAAVVNSGHLDRIAVSHLHITSEKLGKKKRNKKHSVNADTQSQRNLPSNGYLSVTIHLFHTETVFSLAFKINKVLRLSLKFINKALFQI